MLKDITLGQFFPGSSFLHKMDPRMKLILTFALIIIVFVSQGFIGFGMGATSNAMANMQAVARRYGPSPSAYFMIPMVGGLFNDFFNAAIIALSIGLLS